MESQSDSEVEEVVADLVDIRQRFAEMALGDDVRSEGYRAIAEGLGLVLDELEADTETHRARLQVVLRGLHTLADLMSDRDLPGEPSEAEDEADSGGQQFHEMFRKEGQKRLSGLSISMMGIFNDTASPDALEQTADHLHALKGAAAMVGLPNIAELVRAMEQVVRDMQEQDSAERTWPTRALMRGFQLLEDAVKHDTLAIDEDQAGEVIQALKACREAVAEEEQEFGSFSSPRTTQPMPAATRRPPKSAYDGPLEKRILIVDDVDAIAASVGLVLSELDVPIDMAENGEEALEKLQQRPYSLVVSDVNMPRMDGIALTRMIRSDESMEEIPVILLTSLDRPDERDAGIEAGATDYIIKGAIGGGELLDRVKELLALAPSVPAGNFRANSDERRILIAEDVETIAASIAFVLSEGPFEIEIARDGAKAFARLEKEHYDLVLSDVQMPKMDGFELLEAIRSHDELSDTPVILLTSLADPEVQQRALDNGADRFLIKGEVGGDSLLEIVREVSR